MSLPITRDCLCQVVDGSDPDQKGGVRVKVLGVTDNFADEDQPMVYPALGGMQQVPQKGYFLRVRFYDGNINFGKYYGMSQTSTEFPPSYYENYPDVAVANLGEDGFFYEHNRKTHISTITNPGNNTTVTWDADGVVTYESSLASTNSGMNANTGGGTNVQRVLTEGTIDIFTCMPVGSGDMVRQGSEYLQVSHISQATIDALHGNVTAQPAETTPSVPQTEQDVPKMDIINNSGETVDSVPIERTDKMIKRNGKVVKKILICHTEGECFPIMAKKFAETTTNAHYLVGMSSGDPEILGDGKDKSSLKNTGFYQFVDIENDCGAYSGYTINGSKANVDSVVIMLVGSNASTFTEYQKEIIDKLVVHIKKKTGNSDIPVYTTNDFDVPSSTSSMPLFVNEWA